MAVRDAQTLTTRDQSVADSRRRVAEAVCRDEVADARDVAASERDQVADRRDRHAAAGDATETGDTRAVTDPELLLRAADHRRAAAADRAAGAESRARAAADREQSAGDRQQARADRDAFMLQVAIAETDTLTGTRTRAAGLADLQREIDRARRTTGSLIVAYVDVVGLKRVNDVHGHAAGDALLRRAVNAISHHLRSYDSMVRLGGDEFLCILSAATLEDARRRFAAVQTALASDLLPCEIKVGFAALAPGDAAADLVERADAELPISRGR